MNALEINQAIAKAKGLTLDSFSHGDATVFYDAEHTGNLAARNWAESISDAWELFEEMAPATLCSDSEGRYLCNYKFADTAPMAICLAWLKFKGVQL